MITVTLAATAQIKRSAQQGKTESMSLRIAATLNDDKSIHYGMGFDDKKEDDMTISVDGIEIIVAPSSKKLLENTTVDFVELEPGKLQFIFMNPNDANYKPPVE